MVGAVKIINGECRDVLKTLPDQSVHCVVTSPPYFGLRDYGVEGIVRDVAYGAGRLAAIVGGKVRVWQELVGPLQSPDEGGHLHVIDPATSGDRRLTDDERWFRHPALAASGTALVAEGYAVTIDQNPFAPPGVLDTTVTPTGDLWLYGSP